MTTTNEKLRNVAEIAAKIMMGEKALHPNQQKLDVHEPEKDELTADDFKKLRAKKEVKKEEVEELDELSRDTLHSYVKKSFSDKEKPNLNTPERQKGLRKATSRLYKEDEELNEEDAYEKDRYAVKNGKAVKDNPTHQGSPNYKDQPHHVYATSAENALKKHIKKEEVEQMDEVKMADLPVRKVQGRAYGASRPEPHAVDTIKGPNDAELKKIEAEKKKKKFSEMVNLYQDKGLKSLSEMLAKEEATEDEFNKEVEDAKDKAAGKKKQPDIAKGAVQAVKNEETHTTVEVIDLNDVNGVQYSEIELAQERTLTPAETDKKEEIVKGMKKGLSGFKERYGSRANDVMYATATARAKGE